MDAHRTDINIRLAPLGGINVEKRTANVTWSTGAPVERYDPYTGRRFVEVLSMDQAHVDLKRLNSGAPLLDSHQGYSLDKVIGVVERAWIENGEGRATVRFSNREEVEPIWQDVLGGVLKNVSVGYRVLRWSVARDESTNIETRRAVRWEPQELSLVSIGADPGAGVRQQPQDLLTRNDMPPTNPPPAADAATITREANERAASITELCRRHGIAPDLETQWMRSELSLDQVRREVLEQLAARSAARPTGLPYLREHEHSAYVETHNRGDGALTGRAAAMSDALMQRMGFKLKPVAEAAVYRNVGLVGMARELLELRGISTRLMSDDQLVKRALTIGDFPALLSETGNRALLARYEQNMAGVVQVFRRSTAPDFRAKHILKLGEAPELKKMLPQEGIKYGGMAEMKESYKLDTFGAGVIFDRWGIINDDLGAFADLMSRMADAAVEKVSNHLVSVMVANAGMGPTLATDSTTVFHANHNNTGTGAISVASLGAGVAKMRLQKGLDGLTPINIQPAYLVVPAAQEMLARQFTSTAYVSAKSSDVNPYAGQLEVVVDPRLDAVSTTVWYLFSDAQRTPTFEYSYLEGAEGPQVESEISIDFLGIKYRVLLDLGAGAVDFRGAYRSTGA